LYHGICNHSQESSSSRAPAGVDKDRGEIPCMDVRIILLTMRLMMLVAADRGERIRDLEPLGISGFSASKKDHCG